MKGKGKSPGFSTLQSWSTYWTHQSEVLFFGLYSEISGGQMPNLVDGGATYLTVAGSAGSYTFLAPNTAAYIAADTDHIWFELDGTQRPPTTEAELIGYDLQRTPVKYLDDAPNTLEAIMILSADITGDRLDRMFRDFHLSILWNNVLNINGRVKSNRVGQQLWNPLLPELITYTTGLTTPLSNGQATKLNTLVRSLITVTGSTLLSDAFDYFRIQGNETLECAVKNITKDAHHGTITGSPTFVELEGLTGGAGIFIDTDYNPATEGVKYTLNNASYGVYVRTNSASTTYELGQYQNSGNRSYLSTRNAADQIGASVNGAATSFAGITDSRGLTGLNRSESGKIAYSKNGANLVEAVAASAVVLNGNVYELAFHNVGLDTADGFSSRQVAITFYGRAFSNAEWLGIFNAIEAYMDSNGKGVVA